MIDYLLALIQGRQQKRREREREREREIYVVLFQNHAMVSIIPDVSSS